MVRIVIDDPLRDQLDQYDEPVELCDHSGRTIGRFVPAKDPTAEQLAADCCPYSPEELARRRQETGGSSLAEIWKSLGRT